MRCRRTIPELSCMGQFSGLAKVQGLLADVFILNVGWEQLQSPSLQYSQIFTENSILAMPKS